MSHATYLEIVNMTSSEMTTTVSGTDANDWDGNSHPDVNFQNAKISPMGGARKEREEVSSWDSSAWFTMTMKFSNGDEVSLRNDQHDAFSSRNRNYKLGGPDSSKYMARQSSGNNLNSFVIVKS